MLSYKQLLDCLSSICPEIKRLRSYTPIIRDMMQERSRSNSEFIRFRSAQVLFRDFDELFSRFTCESRLDEISKTIGLKIKFRITIIQSWSIRIRKNATQGKFNALLASDHNGSERYIEWEMLVLLTSAFESTLICFCSLSDVAFACRYLFYCLNENC